MTYQTVDPDAYLFADDTKIYNDREALQLDLKKMTEWSEKWLLKFGPVPPTKM